MSSRQLGPDRLLEEQVRGVPVWCYADRPRSIVQVPQDALNECAGDVLLIDPALDQTVTYAEFAALAEGAAAGLVTRDVRAGDRVAVLVRNGLEAAVAIWACARAGLIHVGLPADAPPARLAELLELTRPRLLLCQAGLATVAADAVRIVSEPIPVADAAAMLLDNPRPWQRELPLPEQDTTYCLIPTSGTTGHPKAVRVTGRMTGHAAACYGRTLGLTRAIGLRSTCRSPGSPAMSPSSRPRCPPAGRR